jgi:YegS/Rv2252/BmrU family lipid kinase
VAATGHWFAMPVADILLVASENAGGTDDDVVDEVAKTLARFSRIEVARTRTPGELDDVLRDSRERTVVVAGGDGSLHAVVAALHRQGTLAAADVALVPLGTGNDFARTTGIPVDPVEAANGLAGFVRRPLDLIVDDAGGVVVNVVHAGVGADAAEFAAGLKGRVGTAAYPLGALIAAARADGWRVDVELDGAVVRTGDDPVLMVGVCNGRTIGGGTVLCPPADPGDGALDVVIVTAVGATARIGFGADLRRGKHLDRDDVRHLRGRTVRLSGEAIGYNTDGEIADVAEQRSFSVVPSAWSLRLPPAQK